MILPDVNVLIYAFNQSANDHLAYRDWLDDLINGDSAFAMSELVASGFIRAVTHPKIFPNAFSLEMALAFVETIHNQPHCCLLRPSVRHWSIFKKLCNQSDARGGLISDAYHAALAIEHGCEWITTDRDFARFEQLKWRHPLK